MKKYLSAFIALAAIMGLSACGEKQWSVSGNIDGANGENLVLETSDNGWWYPIDTTTIDSNGDFEMSQAPKGYPDIYRLSFNGKKLYFPIDSIESISVKASAANFDADYKLSGSAAAAQMTAVDSLINAAVRANGEAAIATDSLLKRNIANIIIADPASVVSYYIINKKVGKTSLYSPLNKADLRIIGAVANAYDVQRPNDPRTGYLKNLFLANRQTIPQAVQAENADTMYITETPILDLSLSDYTGKTHSLQEVAQKGNVVVLNFTLYAAEQSPAFNVELARIYEKRKNAGFEIFQVSADPDEFQWKQTAKNLPWITVYNPPTTGAANLMKYNIVALPATFIINRNGELVERVDDITKLDSALNKYM